MVLLLPIQSLLGKLSAYFILSDPLFQFILTPISGILPPIEDQK